MKKPRRLEPGDRLALVAPASPFPREELDAGVAELTRIGFDPVYDDRVFAASRYLAGDPATRAASLLDAWRDPTIRGIVTIRGGYGSAQLLPLIDPALLVASHKVFVGYSDITALLCLHLQHGLVCFHGPMIDRRIALGGDGYDRSSFLAAVAEPAPVGELAPEGVEAFRPGDVTGPLVGGTLTQLVALLGTPWAFMPPQGCVLFIEDIAERPYRVDRMLTQLAQAGVLGRAAALVFGEFPKCDEPNGQYAVKDIVRELTAGFPGPVLFGFPSGHSNGPTWTLPLGVAARVVAAPRPAVVIEEAAVD